MEVEYFVDMQAGPNGEDSNVRCLGLPGKMKVFDIS